MSAGSFLTTVVLARHLPAEEFGRYALVLAVLTVANTAQASFVGVPLHVVRMAAGSPNLVRAALSATALVAGPAVVAVFAVAAAVAGPVAAGAAVLALLGWQAQEALRRVLLAELRYASAVPADVLSYGGQVVVLLVLIAADVPLDVARVCLVIAATSAASERAPARADRSAGAPPRPRGVDRRGDRPRALGAPGQRARTARRLRPHAAVAVFEGSTAVGRFQALITVVGVTNPIMVSSYGLITSLVADTAARRWSPGVRPGPRRPHRRRRHERPRWASS